MRKILTTTLLLSVSLVANIATQKEISDKKAQIAQLQTSLSTLEASLPIIVKKKDNSFVTHAEFGFINTSGNTDTRAYNLDLKINKSWDKHHFNLLLDAQYSDDKGIEKNNKYLLESQYNYEITNKFSFDYLLGYKKDKFSGYNYQLYTGPGAKYTALEEKNHKLVLVGNILYAQDERKRPKLRSDYTSFRAKGVHNWQILDNLKFTQDLNYRVEVDEMDNYFVYAKSSFVSKISDLFSFGIAYKIDYVNKSPASINHTDKTFTANLIIDY